MKLIPEIYVTNLSESRQFFVKVLGFSVKYERPEEQFAYLEFQGNAVMLEGLDGDSRKWLTSELEKPFGRGVNFQWQVENIDELYQRVQRLAPNAIYLPLEHKSYTGKFANKQTVITQTQFIVQPPDGYLFRFCD